MRLRFGRKRDFKERFAGEGEGSRCDFVFVNGKIDAEVMEKAGENLKVISNGAVGFDNVGVAEATRRGIVVTQIHRRRCQSRWLGT